MPSGVARLPLLSDCTLAQYADPHRSHPCGMGGGVWLAGAAAFCGGGAFVPVWVVLGRFGAVWVAAAESKLRLFWMKVNGGAFAAGPAATVVDPVRGGGGAFAGGPSGFAAGGPVGKALSC